jgi:hypothetical protein
VLIAWLAAGVSLWIAAGDTHGGGASMPHLRPRGPLAAAAIEEGSRRSPTFAELVRAIEGSQFIVYVESSRKLKEGMRGCLVHGGTGPRYLRVVLKTGLPMTERIGVLAHELQHVREVIEAGTANDAAAMGTLFTRIGFSTRQRAEQPQEYETAAARQVSAMVARELAAIR